MVSAENGICINDCSLRILTQVICCWSWDLSALRQTEASSMTKTFGQSPDDAHPICSTWAVQIHRQMSPLLLSGHPRLTNQHFGLPEVTSKRAGQAHSNLFLSTCNTHFMYVYMELRHYYYFCLYISGAIWQQIIFTLLMQLLNLIIEISQTTKHELPFCPCLWAQEKFW